MLSLMFCALMALRCGLGWPQVGKCTAAAALDLDCTTWVACGLEQQRAAMSASEFLHFNLSTTQPHFHGWREQRASHMAAERAEIWRWRPAVRNRKFRAARLKAGS